jgi:hypothetical protein
LDASLIRRLSAKRAVAQGVKLGRPKIDSTTERKVRKQLAKGMGILKVAKSLEAYGLTLPPKPKSGRVPVLSQMSQSSRSVDGIHAKPLGVLGPFARQLEKKLTTTWIAHRGSLVEAVLKRSSILVRTDWGPKKPSGLIYRSAPKV